MKSRVISKVFDFTILIVAVVFYVLMAFYLKRYETLWLIISVAGLFGCYLYFILYSEFSVTQLLVLALFFRILFLFSDPELSDDYWRFIWDGNMVKYGYNPYSHTPKEAIQLSGAFELENIYLRLNNCCTHSTYTPFTQLIFYVAVLLGEIWRDPVFWMKIVVLLAELGSACMIINILKSTGQSVRNAGWYLLNPLVILEFTANLHHEVFVVFFICLVLFFLLRGNSQGVAFSLGAAVSAKLLPLIFLPGLLKGKRWLPGIIFSSLVLVIPALSYWPWLSVDATTGFITGLRLYFDKFEFNPSIWYVVRAIGFQLSGFNIIQWAVPVMAVCSAALIFWYSLLRPGSSIKKPEEASRMFEVVLFIYLIFSSIVHPWYVAPLVLFAVFSGNRFGILWSGLVMLTYGGYSTSGYQEYPLILVVEYFLVGVFFVMERKQIWVSNG